MTSNRNNPRNMGRAGARMASSGAGMSRGRFLRTAGISAAGLGAAAMGLGGVVNATSGYDTVIYPEDGPSALQSAVTAGGKILIRAVNRQGVPTVLDLGTSIIDISHGVDVEIVGEKLGHTIGKDWNKNGAYNQQFHDGFGNPIVMSDRAVIYRGGARGYREGSFKCNTDAFFSCNGLRFHESKGSAIFLHKSTGATVSDNVVTDLKASWLTLFGGSYKVFRFAIGIFANGHPGHPYDPFGDGSHSGDVVIENNGIDIFGDDINQDVDSEPIDFASAVGVSDFTTQVNVFISDNTMQNPGYAGIWLAGHYPTSMVTVNGNRVFQREYGFEDLFWVTGINVYTHHLGPFGTFPVGRAHIEGNHFHNCMNEDVGLQCSGSVASHNTVYKNAHWYASFYVVGDNNIIQHNDFSQTNYPGWSFNEDGYPITFGCIELYGNSNEVMEHPQLGTKYFPGGTSMCNQINWDPNSTSTVHQWENFCANPPNKNLARIRERFEEHQAKKELKIELPK